MSISAEIIPLCALQDNYIWMFFNRESKKAWIVDPGEATPAIQALAHHDLQLSGIFITHHHHDHSGGVKDLIHHHGVVPIYGSHKSSLPFITHHVKEGDHVTCDHITFKVIEIPGHTLDHTAFFGNNWLFSGDTLFSAGCGRIFEGTPDQMYDSLAKLSALPDKTHVFCGHEYTLSNLYFAQHVEPTNNTIAEKINLIKELREHNKPTLPSTILEEKSINPFLRCDDASVVKAVENYAGHTLKTPVHVFAKLREWKNQFKST